MPVSLLILLFHTSLWLKKVGSPASKALLDNFHWLGDTFGGLANGSLVLPQLPEEIVRDIRAAYGEFADVFT